MLLLYSQKLLFPDKIANEMEKRKQVQSCEIAAITHHHHPPLSPKTNFYFFLLL